MRSDPLRPRLTPEAALAERRLLRVQAISGSVFLVFTLLHLANTGVAALGVAPYTAWQTAARGFYQHPAAEVGLLAMPLAVHGGAAIARLRRSGLRGRDRRLRARLHRATGLFLLVVIWGHVAATRGPSLLAGVDVGFAAVAWTFEWMPFWFYPYYTLLGLAGLYHGLNGLLIAASLAGMRVPAGWRRGPAFWLPFGAAALFVLVGLAALGGGLFEIPDPAASEYARWISGWMGEGT